MYKVQFKSELRGTKGIWSYHEEKEEDENTSILDESVISSVKKETCHCNHDAECYKNPSQLRVSFQLGEMLLISAGT